VVLVNILRIISRKWLVLLALLLVASCFAGLVQAGSGGIVGLPLPRVRNRSGLLLEIDTRWVDGGGYRPVRVRIFPFFRGPAAADRRIEVTLTPRSPYNGTPKTTVTATVEISQGSSVGETTIPVPCSESWYQLDVSTSEDGRRLSDLSEKRVSSGNHYHYEWNEATPSILLIDADAPSYSQATRKIDKQPQRRLPDFRTLTAMIPRDPWGGSNADVDVIDEISDSALLRMLPDLPKIEILPPTAIPSSWIELMAVDMIFAPLEEILELVDAHPTRWNAIRSWLATGPVLVVYAVGDEYERLAELEAILGLPPSNETDSVRGWSRPDAANYGITVFDNSQYRNIRPTGVTQPTNKSKTPPPTDLTPFVVRAVERGQVAAMATDDPFPGTPELWNWLLYSLGDQRWKHWKWYQRNGVSLQRENDEYWNLLIPGVGQAPVNSFLMLISLFVIVIGPVNYYYLRRRGRLYLLLVTVPAGAFVVTSGLLLYALLTDGLGVRSRIRSITEIDQRTNRIVSSSRQTYYAGLSPSSGLTFPTDVAAIPVDFRPQRMRSRGRRTDWRRDQRLSGGHFPSRSTVQFLVLESKEAKQSIEIGEVASDGSLTVTNRLGVEIAQLIVRGSNGGYFSGSSIGNGKSQALEESTQQIEARRWNAVIAQHKPQYPVGFDPQQIENAADIFGFRYRLGNQSLSAPSFADSVFERGLRQAWTAQGLNFRTYLAVVPQGPSVSVGAEAEEQAGFHVVMGRW
jgi:hypothetical protein